MILSKMKYKCYKCNKFAVWMYMPGHGNDNDYWCDECVSRGCSCNLNDDGTMPLDESGKEYPCCEYDYSEEGYEDEYEDEDTR